MAGQIVKRGERTFTVRVYQGRNGEGKRLYLNKTVHGTKKEADAVLRSLLTDKDMGTLAKPKRETLDAHITRWLDVTVKARVRARTHDDYSELADRYIKPALGKLHLHQLDAATIQSFYAGLLDKGLSARTVRHTHAVLRNALKQAVRWNLLPFNPCDHVDLPKVKRTEMMALSQEQSREFLKAARDDPFQAFFALLLSTGMRPSEALALRWSDVDLTAQYVQVCRSLSGRKGAKAFTDPKTNKSRRRIPIPSSLAALMKAEKEAQAADTDRPTDAFGLVFSNREGRPLDLRNLTNRHFKAIVKSAKLPAHFRLYDLRHTCATLMLAAGVNPKIVAERLGHSTVMLTLDTYSHILPDMQEEATGKLEAALFGA